MCMFLNVVTLSVVYHTSIFSNCIKFLPRCGRRLTESLPELTDQREMIPSGRKLNWLLNYIQKLECSKFFILGKLILGNNAALNGADAFERGHTDLFDVHGPVVGKIKKIVIGHDNEGSGAAWYPESVSMFFFRGGITRKFRITE